MRYETIARRYARALYEIGKEAGNLAALARDLSDVAASYAASPELATALDNPLVPEREREAVLREVGKRAGASETAQNALLLLLRKHRIAAIGDVSRQLDRLADEEAGVVRATVTSAAQLSDAYLARLRGELEKATGKKVVVTHRRDPSLLAGVVTQVGDRVLDGSLRAQLARVRDTLLAP